MAVILTSLAGPVSAGATQATLSGLSGVGNPISIVMPAGQVPIGVQFYRNGSPISGATSSPYNQTSADIPARGAADITITATYTGVSYVSTAFVNSNPAIDTTPGQPAKPVLTALTAAVSVAYTVPSDGGSPILEAQFTDINGVSTTLTGNPQTIAEAAGAPITGAVRFRNAIGWSDYSPQSNQVTPTTPVTTSAVSKAFNASAFNFTF